MSPATHVLPETLAPFVPASRPGLRGRMAIGSMIECASTPTRWFLLLCCAGRASPSPLLRDIRRLSDGSSAVRQRTDSIYSFCQIGLSTRTRIQPAQLRFVTGIQLSHQQPQHTASRERGPESAPRLGRQASKPPRLALPRKGLISARQGVGPSVEPTDEAFSRAHRLTRDLFIFFFNFFDTVASVSARVYQQPFRL